jgi:hypothetical protein
MDYFPRESLSKYLMDMIDFNKHLHDIDIFINDKWRKYEGGDIGRLFKLQGDLNFAFDQREAKLTFTRRLLRPNRHPTWTPDFKNSIWRLIHTRILNYNMFVDLTAHISQ